MGHLDLSLIVFRVASANSDVSYADGAAPIARVARLSRALPGLCGTAKVVRASQRISDRQ